MEGKAAVGSHAGFMRTFCIAGPINVSGKPKYESYAHVSHSRTRDCAHQGRMRAYGQPITLPSRPADVRIKTDAHRPCRRSG